MDSTTVHCIKDVVLSKLTLLKKCMPNRTIVCILRIKSLSLLDLHYSSSHPSFHSTLFRPQLRFNKIVDKNLTKQNRRYCSSIIKQSSPRSRVVLPLTVEEYQVGQLYAVVEASKAETGGGDGVEVLKNEPFTDHPEFGSGQYTHKIYHLQRLVDSTLIRSIICKG